ncbi:MAG: DsbA family protein [Proteobacteria bacterium]|jgi:CxxC motif-containing protein (DUF1111 family)|nr:DsbA family protein [Pseudomonadota bacterium]MCG2744586.1 DsbA family protein [Desulfobacteraceae bacterium]MBU3982876.1 DsbA family protein [Pseudomonadota bacterium]MBU4028506.1 DsbA family protein [Pseudomonadota bacterium]MBU4041645.1 DsbA family protein [Pseudomonadota bacterium]
MIKRILICLFALLLVGAAHAEEKITDIPTGNSPSIGPADAPVTIIEFIDFQ